MTAPVVVAAALGATAVFLLVRVAVGDTIRLPARIDPYTVRARRSLGTTTAVSSTTTSRSVWGPMLTSLTTAVAALADTGEHDTLEVRLSNAGLDVAVDDYRRRQLLTTVAGATAGVALAAVLDLAALGSLVVVALCVFAGTTRQRAVLNGRIEHRRQVMQAESHVICQLLATYLRTGDTPMGALDRLCRRTTGEIPTELTTAAGLIRRGRPAGDVLDELAARSTEPYAARLYRLYGATWNASGDPDALLSLAHVLRNGRREHLARRMARRRTLMALPLVMVIGPILILFIAAAIPTIVLGR